MYSSKLLRIIRVFNDKSLNELEGYVHSRCFNKDKLSSDIIKLFNYIREQYPNYGETAFQKEKVFLYIYPTADFNKSRLDLLMNKLLKIVKTFIKHQYTIVKEPEISELIALVEFSRKNNLTKQFGLFVKALRKKQEGIHIRDRDYYYNDFLINQEIVLFNSVYNQKKDDLNILETIKSLDSYYLIAKLEYTCALLSISKEISVDLEDSIVLLKTLSPLIEKGSLAVPLLKVYYHAFLLLSNEEEEEIYFKYKSVLKEHQDCIPHAQLKSFQAHARNYCIGRYNSGSIKYLKEVFELYQDHLEQGFIYYNGGLLPNTFQGITTVGLKLKAYNWVERFLKEHKNKIVGTQSPDEVYNFNLANYYFHKEAYEEALASLASTYENTYYTIYAKRLEIKIYVETKSVLLDSKILNFKLYVFRNNKLSSSRKKANNNFIDILKQVIHYKTMSNEKRIASIKRKIESKKRLAEKEWLLEQLERLR